uniref:Uncharacterized protein n=1 Tax=Oryza barthii TaxID=65489 RepID=A0A0D3FYB2_9ORYZ
MAASMKANIERRKTREVRGHAPSPLFPAGRCPRRTPLVSPGYSLSSPANERRHRSSPISIANRVTRLPLSPGHPPLFSPACSCLAAALLPMLVMPWRLAAAMSASGLDADPILVGAAPSRRRHCPSPATRRGATRRGAR